VDGRRNSGYMYTLHGYVIPTPLDNVLVQSARHRRGSSRRGIHSTDMSVWSVWWPVHVRHADRQTDKETHKQTSTSMSAVSVWSVVQVQRTPTRQCRLVYASRWRLWYRGRRHSARDTDDTIRHEMQSERALESRHETAKSTARNRNEKSGRSSK